MVRQHGLEIREADAAHDPRCQLWSQGHRCRGAGQEVFHQLRLDKHYEEYEAQAYNRTNTLIDAVPEVTSPCGEAVLRRAVFRTFLEKIYKRTK